MGGRLLKFEFGFGFVAVVGLALGLELRSGLKWGYLHDDTALLFFECAPSIALEEVGVLHETHDRQLSHKVGTIRNPSEPLHCDTLALPRVCRSENESEERELLSNHNHNLTLTDK